MNHLQLAVQVHADTNMPEGGIAQQNISSISIAGQSD